MVEKKPPRVYVSVRLAPRAVDLLDSVAEEHRVSRSEVIRAALSVGLVSPKTIEILNRSSL